MKVFIVYILLQNIATQKVIKIPSNTLTEAKDIFDCMTKIIVDPPSLNFGLEIVGISVIEMTKSGGEMVENL